MIIRKNKKKATADLKRDSKKVYVIYNNYKGRILFVPYTFGKLKEKNEGKSSERKDEDKRPSLNLLKMCYSTGFFGKEQKDKSLKTE